MKGIQQKITHHLLPICQHSSHLKETIPDQVVKQSVKSYLKSMGIVTQGKIDNYELSP